MTDDNRSLAEWAALEAQETSPAAVTEQAPREAIPEPEPVEPAAPEVVAEEPTPQEEAAAVEEQPAPEAPAVKKPQPLPKWMKDRIGEESGKRHEAERRAAEEKARADAAEAALEAMRRRGAGEEPVTETPPPVRPAEGYVPATEVETRARQLAAEQAFNDRANASYREGKKVYQDFDEAVGTLAALNAVQRRDFQEAALATGAAHDVIYHLGSNPEEAQAILADLASGSVAKATAAMTKIATKVAATRAAPKKAAEGVSKAPAPIKPVGGSAVPVVDLDKMSDDDFTSELNKKARENGWW